jgi:hypothetical protein
MKRYTRCLLYSVLVLGFQGTSWPNHHEDKLAGIIDRFSNEDTALQYEARRELASYVADGTAPSQVNGAEKVTKELLAYIKDAKVPHEAKKYMVRDLARVGTAAAIAPLSKIMTGSDGLLAEAARQALEQIQGGNASSALKKAIDNAKDDDQRRVYIRTLANRAEQVNAGYFKRGLKSGDAVLAHESALALALLRDAQSVKALEAAYHSSSGDLKIVLENELLRLGGTSDKLVVEIQQNAVVASNKQAALVRVMSSGHGESTDLLKAALSSADSALRATAIRLALTHGKQSLVRNMVDSLSSDEWRIVLNALFSFAGKGAEDLALKAVEEGDVGVQIQALRALATYGGNRSVDVLLAYHSGKDKALQQAATYAIERMPGTPLNNRMNRLLKSESEDDLALGIQLLAHRDIPNAKGRLFKFINGESSMLATEALKTLSTTANEEDLYKLLFLVRRSEEPLKKTITGMLKKVASEIGSLELQAKVAAL